MNIMYKIKYMTFNYENDETGSKDKGAPQGVTLLFSAMLLLS